MENHYFDLNDEDELFCIHLDEKGKESYREFLCKDFGVVAIRRDVDTDEIFVRLVVYYGGKYVEKDIPLHHLLPSKLADYSKYGFPFLDYHKRSLISEWLISIQGLFPIKETTQGLGWKSMDDKDYFQLQHSISRSKMIKVEYSGDLLVSTKGKYEEYFEFMQKSVLPFIQTQAIVAFSVSAALAAYIDTDLTLIMHLCGTSTTGKTTMLMLAASVWGSAERKSNGIMQAWNATNNALLNELCGYNGITICFDELGSSDADAKSFLALVYKISMGIDKKRMGYDSSNQSFRVNICSSGEIPIKVVQEVNGVDVRLLEMDYNWTESKDHAESIKSDLSKCYGHLGRVFVKILLKSPKDKLKIYLKKITSEILSEYEEELSGMTDNNRRIFERAVQKIAVVAFAAHIMKKKMKLEFKPLSIAKFLIEHSKLLEMPSNEHIQFLEIYLNALSEQRLSIKREQPFAKNELYPSDFIKDDYLIIRAHRFYAIMARHGYSREACVAHLQHLKNDGFLHTEKGKLYNRRAFKKERCACIELNIKKLEQEGIEYPQWRSKVNVNEECDK